MDERPGDSALRRVVERARRLPRRVMVAIAAAVALAVAGGLTVAISGAGGEQVASPVEVAGKFLEAVRAKDIRAAYALTDVAPPTGTPYETFLDPRALRDDWRVVEIRERPPRDTATPTAAVDYTLRGPDDQLGHGELRFAKPDGVRWQLRNPTVPVAIPYSPLRYVDVNAMHVAREYDDRRAVPTYALLPGLYDFYGRDSTPLLTESPRPRFVTETGAGAEPITVRPPALDDQAWWDALDQQVTTAIDECARQPVLNPPGCPFGAPASIQVHTSTDSVAVTAIQDITWTVLEPFFVERNPAEISMREDYLEVVAADGLDGRVRLSATGTTPADQRIAFTAECVLGTANVLRASVAAADGSLTLSAAESPYLPCRVGDRV